MQGRAILHERCGKVGVWEISKPNAPGLATAKCAPFRAAAAITDEDRRTAHNRPGPSRGVENTRRIRAQDGTRIRRRALACAWIPQCATQGCASAEPQSRRASDANLGRNEAGRWNS